MKVAVKPANELQRLAALRRYMLLDTLPEPEFDRITSLVAQLLDMPIALMSLVDEDRQWFKSAVGFEGKETSRDTAFCAHAINDRTPLVVPDAHRDERFDDNPFVVGAPNVRFYAGAPLTTLDGFALGTLCVIDRKPRELTAQQLSLLSSMAAVVVDLVEARLGFRAREMFEKVAALSPDAIYVLDVAARKVLYGNDKVLPLRGHDGGLADLATMESTLHPDDVAGVRAHFGELATLPDGGVVELTFRSQDEDGAYRWMRARETVFERDANGAPQQILGVAVDITELEAARARLAELADTDELTGLPNKRALRTRLAQLSLEGARGRKFAIAVADVDYFKRINDTYGHAVGDQVLAAVAAALRANTRAVDLVGRFGGEEFVVLYADVDEATAAMLAERLRLAIKAIETPVGVTCSFGVSANNGELASNGDRVLEAADAALYRAKHAGRDRVVRSDA
ncbi:MAG: diguanylate cyclase [Kofleriaceae bacterium]|nr:diguanylate cyclase [Kofleriaceae bacterium]